MYVCVCKAVTEKDIHAAVQTGARTMKDLREQLGVGEDCGCCGSCAKQCLRDARHDTAHPSLTVVSSSTAGFYAAA